MKVFLSFIFLLCYSGAFSQNCEGNPYYSKMDFWLGDWDVFISSGQKVGTNTITKILNGCAVREEWVDAGGSKGNSLFFVDNTNNQWQQIWVTEEAGQPGGQKHKKLIEELEDGSLRFQGVVVFNGKQVLDRTTLSLQMDGSVHQKIERSMDGGQTWQGGFVGIYKKRASVKDQIKALNQQYVDGWLKGDSARVMSTFAREAVIIPDRMDPIKGYEAIKKYWWPNDGSVTNITAYSSPVSQLEQYGNVVVAMGVGTLSFDYEKGDMQMSRTSKSRFQTVYQKQSDNEWKIISRTWSRIE